jgi:hypothetical protein
MNELTVSGVDQSRLGLQWAELIQILVQFRVPESYDVPGCNLLLGLVLHYSSTRMFLYPISTG